LLDLGQPKHVEADISRSTPKRRETAILISGEDRERPFWVGTARKNCLAIGLLYVDLTIALAVSGMEGEFKKVDRALGQQH